MCDHARILKLKKWAAEIAKIFTDVVQDTSDSKIWTTNVGVFVQLSRKKGYMVKEIIQKVSKHHPYVVVKYDV